MPILRDRRASGISRIVRQSSGIFRPFLPETIAFRDLSGATDLTAIDAIGRYLKNQNLWANSVLYTEKADQNAGSGSTVYPYGGLTPNLRTLVNSPTWGANGITYNGSDQYASIADFLSNDTLHLITRIEVKTGNDAGYILSQFNYGAVNQRSTSLGYGVGTDIRLIRSSNGQSSTNDVDDVSPSGITSGETTLLWSSFVNGLTPPYLWVGKTSKTLVDTSGGPTTTAFDSTSPIMSMAGLLNGAPVSHVDGVKVCDLIITGSVSATQRENLTDLIYAL